MARIEQILGLQPRSASIDNAGLRGLQKVTCDILEVEVGRLEKVGIQRKGTMAQSLSLPITDPGRCEPKWNPRGLWEAL